ncbi:MAG: phosphate acyltransferase PlsX [Chitinophagaceae bacterium]|jgi:glycerol-3-phosphate acyltransferase PlsX|nr:phosphate acyltransferase PlsX [Chitinophagaceae bacterium]
MNIGLDMMGGDFAPLEAVKGIQMYLSEQNDSPANLFLIGDEEKINQLLIDHKVDSTHLTVVHAPQEIDMHESPIKALKEKPQSSISIGFQYLAAGKTDAFISAGNTGAMLVGSMFSLKVIEGVLRPTIATVLPKENGGTGLLVDVGINVDCKPENLNQFAIMGSIYAQWMFGVNTPRVGLINVGEEEGKGNMIAQAAYPLLKENKQINFVGNIEGRDLLFDKADVMVCDGFTGNIILKMAESLFELAQLKKIEHSHFDLFNFEIYGGTPVLGVSKPVMIGHGISHALAFKNMIIAAKKMADTNLLAKMQQAFT